MSSTVFGVSQFRFQLFCPFNLFCQPLGLVRSIGLRRLEGAFKICHLLAQYLNTLVTGGPFRRSVRKGGASFCQVSFHAYCHCFLT